MSPHVEFKDHPYLTLEIGMYGGESVEVIEELSVTDQLKKQLK
jgi:hypothetical protein